MKRTLEKLAKTRQDKEDDFSAKLNELKKLSETYIDILKALPPTDQFSHLAQSPIKTTSRISRKSSATKESPDTFQSHTTELLQSYRNLLEQNLTLTQELFGGLLELAAKGSEVVDVKDKEWDALSSNHVAMIFKSMEWRIEKLTAEYEDAILLMKNFVSLREHLQRLQALLEEKKMPSPGLMKEITQPIADVAYAGFENRFRGSEADVKRQQEIYLPYFQTDNKVLDLGCGRGEFLDLLKQQKTPSEGIDLNAQMIQHCQDKGHSCHQGDILEKLREYPDNSLGGIFSSQVVEHMPPEYVKRLVDLAYFKLISGSYMVLETVNPTSVFSLVQIYFLDISHKQPIHPRTLQFLMENAGFIEVEIKYSSPFEAEQLQTLPSADETSAILNQNLDKLNQLLYAPANYAAVGIKK